MYVRLFAKNNNILALCYKEFACKSTKLCSQVFQYHYMDTANFKGMDQ